ncbi:DUF1819 family protein [Peptostreptococcus sp.]|uniref:DUF1819 family protein n=1 Tax=Peptostreptococcus sp. TaxID=1262 RepID=UPI001CAE5D5B|nr:DUF1819 family protein [Peptostreptococcus sp.]MBF1049797.1 DUF1819 family protein [Peptostreptococcus sp.]
MINDKYSAGLVSQSFWFVEFKGIVKLIESGRTDDEIKTLCLEENFFGASKEYRAKRIYGYIWNRVKQMDEAMIKLFVESDLATQKIINLICILKMDRLFFEFIYEVYREKAILGFDKIEDVDMNIFFNEKEIQNADIANWKDATKKRLRNIYTNYMIDANLLTLENNEKKITIPILDIALERHLKATGGEVLVKALTGVR